MSQSDWRAVLRDVRLVATFCATLSPSVLRLWLQLAGSVRSSACTGNTSWQRRQDRVWQAGTLDMAGAGPKQGQVALV